MTSSKLKKRKMLKRGIDNMKKMITALFLSATVLSLGLTARAIAACYSEDLVGEKGAPDVKIERPARLNTHKGELMTVSTDK